MFFVTMLTVTFSWLDKYKDVQEAAKRGKGVDLRKYVACGIVVFDLQTMEVKWDVLLDLTADDDSNFKVSGQFSALHVGLHLQGFIYGPPTVVDMDGDGELEIVVGTTTGFVYVLNSQGILRNFGLNKSNSIQGFGTLE